MIGYFQLILNGLNLVWLMVTAIFMFMMQVGFVYMSAGASHAKNSSSILTSHLIIIATSTIVFTIIGSEMITNANGGLVGGPGDHQMTIDVQEIDELNKSAIDSISTKLFAYNRCLTATMIAATQMQERTLTETYILLTVSMAGIIYPLAQSWVEGDGWLQRIGYIDSTSSSCIYLCGGVCGFVGNLMLGGRLSIFQK